MGKELEQTFLQRRHKVTNKHMKNMLNIIQNVLVGR